MATHIPADANGLQVNLGSNNDVTVTSGTVTVGGTATVSVAGTASAAITSIAAGTASIGAVGLSAGTAYAGVMAIGTASTVKASMLSLTSGTALAVGILDSDGAQVALTAPVVVGGTITNGTSAFAAGDTMGTAVAFSNATSGSGKTGHLIRAVCFDPSDQGQDIYLWLFNASVTPSADNAAFSLSDADLLKTVGVVTFTDWYDATNGQVSVGRLTPAGHPLAIQTVGAATLYGVAQSQGTGTYATASISFGLQVARD